MKQQPIHFVGLDVHQSTVVASVRDESGKVVMKATVPTEEKAVWHCCDRGRGCTLPSRKERRLSGCTTC